MKHKLSPRGLAVREKSFETRIQSKNYRTNEHEYRTVRERQIFQTKKRPGWPARSIPHSAPFSSNFDAACHR